MKGFYFSLDAIMGLMLIGLGAVLIISTSQVSQGLTSDKVEFDSHSAQAIDVSYLMLEEDFSAINSSYREQLIEETALNREDTVSIGRALVKLHDENEPEAMELAELYFDTFDRKSGLYIEGEEVVSISASDQSAISFMVPNRNNPRELTVVVGE